MNSRLGLSRVQQLVVVGVAAKVGLTEGDIVRVVELVGVL
jgi:hypothetical protein